MTQTDFAAEPLIHFGFFGGVIALMALWDPRAAASAGDRPGLAVVEQPRRRRDGFA